MSPSPVAPAPGRIDDLDTLRAFAMTAVIAQHCKILPLGWMGVWLFFVISGFVVTTSLMARAADPTASVLAGFYLRRAARILPIYLIYVCFGFLVSGLSTHRFPWSAFASLVLFYNNFQSAFAHGAFPVFPVAHLWTLSVEMQFYLLFGFAFVLLDRRWLMRLLVAMLILAPALRLAAGFWLAREGYRPLPAAFIIYTFSPMHFDSFAVGGLLALARARLTRPVTARVLFLAGCVAMALYILAFIAIDHHRGARGISVLKNIVSGILIGQTREVWLYSAVALLSAGVMAVTLSGAAPWGRVTRSPLLQAVGRVSYGGYVYHALVVVVISAGLGAMIHPGHTMAARLGLGAVRFCLVLPVTIALAHASYRFLERPIIAWAHGRHRAPASAEVAP